MGVWQARTLNSGRGVREVGSIHVVVRAQSEPVRRGPGVRGQSPLERGVVIEWNARGCARWREGRSRREDEVYEADGEGSGQAMEGWFRPVG